MQAYYAIIPASVRYKKEIPDGAKLLYGEITACCDKRGFSDQENEYFEKLYGKSERTIQRWVKALEKAGHIDVVIIPTDKGSERHIYIREAFDALQSGQIKGRGDKNVGGGGVTKMSGGGRQKCHPKNKTKDNKDPDGSLAPPETAAREEREKLRKTIIALFIRDYEKLYGEKLMLTGKELGAIRSVLGALGGYDPDRRDAVLRQKAELLLAVARKRNKFQPWRFLPSQLILRWNDLVPGCVLGSDAPAEEPRPSSRPPVVRAPKDYE